MISVGWLIFWVVLVLIIIIAVVLLFVFVFKRKPVSKEVQDWNEKMGENPTRVINFCSKFTGGHALLDIAGVPEGIGLGGVNRYYVFPRDVRISASLFGIEGDEELDNLQKVTIDPSCVIDLPRHTFSDHIDFKVFLPSRVEDLPVGIRPIFEPYLRAREILEPFKDAYYQGMADKDALMKVLVSAGDLGDVFLKSVTKVWDMTKPSNVLVGKPFFQQKIEKTEGGE